MIVIHNEEAMKAHLRTIKQPFTKFMPVEINGWTYNARTIQQAWKKVNKRGVYVTDTSIVNGAVCISYKTSDSKGKFTINPIIYTGSKVGRGEFQLISNVF